MNTHPRSIFHSIVLFALVLSVFGGALLAMPAHAIIGTIRYVTPTGLTSGTCSTWGTACGLQYALNTVAVSGDELWVKQGTYKPGAARSDTFTLKTGVSIYGGFTGTETLLVQRNPATHVTVLSGAIGASTSSDNSYHVVTSAASDSTARLDGFTVTAGNANGSWPDSPGGGMINWSSSPTLTNVIFDGNAAAGYGGGMYNNDSNPTLTNVTFSSNNADFGGGMNNGTSSPTLTNVTFTGNTAVTGAGGMSNDTSNPMLTNVTFSGNTTPGGIGGGMYNHASSPTLTNLTFSGNSAGNGGGMMNDTSSSPVIYDSIFWNDGTEIFDSSSAPVFVDSIVSGGCPAGATCTDVFSANPLLGVLANNGGYTKTMALGTGSPAIDAGGANHACAVKDQRGVKRPQGPACDIGAYEAPLTKVFQSTGSLDGWILESGESTSVGGSMLATGPTLILGDDAARKQYRSIVSFSTASLPDNAVIGSVTLKLRRSSVTPAASNPVSLLQGIMLDVKKGPFGSTSGLQLGDFQIAPSKIIGPYAPSSSAGYYTITLPSTAWPYINKLSTNGGLTQLRLRFKLDDNNDAVANYISFFSGNVAAANRPVLTVTFHVP
jgi:hypothetical protein